MWEYGSGYFNGLKLSDLGVDQAYVNISSYASETSWIYSLSEECVKCPFSKLRDINSNKHITTKVDTSRYFQWKLYNNDVGPYGFNNDSKESIICTISPDVGAFGVYELNIYDDNCEFHTLKEPTNSLLSLIYIIIILLFAALLLRVSSRLYRKFKSHTTQTTVTTSPSDNNTIDTELDKPKQIKPRLRSLDTFRGIAIVLMIFVNSGGGRYWWIEHSTWNGLHVADLLFPWFLWIMGVCIPMSIKSQMSRNTSRGDMLWNVFKRSCKLFFIGLCLNTAWGVTRFSALRIMNVLQRFGIAYFVVTSLHILLSKPINVLPQSNIKRSLFDIITLIPQWVIMIIFIILHLVIVFQLPVPGCPKGYLGPGGKHDMGEHFDCIGGATGYIDRLILGDKHIYQHPTASRVYDAGAFDPEGLFGCLLTFVQVFFGLQCGMTLIIHQEHKSRVKRWLLWAVILGVLGGVLCGFSQENGIIPVNKNLWSLSYVLVTSSFAFILLSVCYMIIDVKNYWSGSPLIYAGMNAIIMYVGHEIFHSMMPFHWRFDLMNTHFIHLVENIWNTVLWMCIAYYLYCKKIFFSV